MVHLLIQCQTSKNIWNSIIKIIYDGTGTPINLTQKEIQQTNQLVHKIKEVREIQYAIYWDRDQENKFKEKWEILHQI